MFKQKYELSHLNKAYGANAVHSTPIKRLKKRNSDFKKNPTKLSFVSYTCRCNLRHYISSKKEHSSITCWVELNTNLKWKLYKGILKTKSKPIYTLTWMNAKMGWQAGKNSSGGHHKN